MARFPPLGLACTAILLVAGCGSAVPGAPTARPSSAPSAPAPTATAAPAAATEPVWDGCSGLREVEPSTPPAPPPEGWLSPALCGEVEGWAGIGMVSAGYAYAFSKDAQRFVRCEGDREACELLDLRSDQVVRRVVPDWGRDGAGSRPVEKTSAVARLFREFGAAEPGATFPYQSDLYVSWSIAGRGERLVVTLVDRATSTEHTVLRFPLHAVRSDAPIVPQRAWLAPDGSTLAFRVATTQGGTGIELGLVNLHAEAAALYREVAAKKDGAAREALLQKAARAEQRDFPEHPEHAAPPDAAAVDLPVDDELAPGAALDAAWFVILGDTAVPLACHVGGTKRLVHGGACARALPKGAELVTREGRLHAGAPATFTCLPNDERMPGLRVERKLARSVLAAWSLPGPGRLELVPPPGRELRADLDGRAGDERLAAVHDGIVLSRPGAADVPAAPSSQNGDFLLLGSADVDSDGQRLVFWSWDYGHGWGFAAGKLVRDALHVAGTIECGS